MQSFLKRRSSEQSMELIDGEAELNRLPMTFQELIESGIQSTPQITGQASLINKDNLIGVPFIITDFEVRDSSFGNIDYITVNVKTQVNENLCFNDSGVGIRPVLDAWQRDFPGSRGLMCAKGLRKSEYTNDAGIEGTTFYLT